MPTNDLDAHSNSSLTRDPDSTLTAHTLPVVKLSHADAVEPLPERIGNFRIIRLIGSGGMGAVYEAEQDNPRRRVALKVIRAGYASRDSLKRFELEAHILGRLQHPGIAQIYHAGLADTGHGTQPYFAMELVEGTSLTRYARDHKLGTRQRLALIAQIAEAVQHAHAKGIVHRDLKPGNILVTADGRTKILDFGIARATDSDLQLTTVHTDIGKIVGTLPYMSPEQASGDPGDLDTRSDIYALGVVLYELLVGRLPHDVTRKTALEAIRLIREEEPTRLASLNRTFRGDVETIVNKAIEKDKTHRYQTANDFAADIRHYLADEPIAARPPSASYQFRKFARRNKALVGGVAAVMVALTAGAVVAGWQAVRARRAEHVAQSERDRAQTQAAKAEQVAAFTQTILGSIDPSKAKGMDTQLMRQVLGTAAGRIDQELASQPEVAASIRYTIGRAYSSISDFDPAFENLRAAHALQSERLGPDAPESLQTRAAIATVLSRQGKYSEAEQWTRAVLDDRRRILGPDHRDTLASASRLGDVLARSGKATEGEKLLRDTLDRQKRILGETDADVATTMLSLSICLWKLDQGAEAESFARRELEIRERTGGRDDPETISALGNLAMMLENQEKLDESKAAYSDLIARAERYFGPTHQTTLSIKNNYASLLASSGRLPDAEKILREVLEVRRKAGDEDHVDSLGTMLGLTRVLQKERRFDDAEAVARRMIELSERRYGEDSRENLHSVSALAFVFLAQGRKSDALPSMRRAAELDRKVNGEQAETYWLSLYNLAATADDLGDHESSLKSFREIVQLWEKYGKNRDLPYIAAAHCSLARLTADGGDFAAAEPIFAKSLEMRRRLYPPKHMQLAYSLDPFGLACLNAGKPARAEPLFREAIECVRSTDGFRPVDVAEIQSELGQALADQKKFAEAEPEIIAAATVLRDSPQSSNKMKRTAIERVVGLYEKWDDSDANAQAAKLNSWRKALDAIPTEESAAPSADPTPD